MDTALQTALEKGRHFCAYQERCHTEVREKLYSLGLHRNEVETVLTQLIEEDFLNEERFAIAYAGGKFRMKQWGKEKIKYGLLQKKVSDYCIKKALLAINNADYDATFQAVASKKLRTLKSETNSFTRKRKMKDFLQQRGFEFNRINDYLKQL